LRLTGEKSALGQRGSFKVVKKAALVSSPPNWRHYLLIGFPEGEAPHPTLHPQGQKEKALWKKRATLGFGVGVEEAESLWNSRVLELVRDFTGTLLFYELLAEGTIGGPQVKESTQASTRSNEELVLRLTEYGLVEEGGFLAAKPSPKSPPVKTF
jgi:defect-in-organelle-trafficking protein DotC